MLTDFQKRRTLGFPRQGECPPLIFSDPVILLDPIRDSQSSPPSWQDGRE